jgi:acetolactate decarboxylase
MLKKQPYAWTCVGLLTLVMMLAAGCASDSSIDYAANPVAGRETLTQVSTINALMAGVYDGVLTCGKLKGYGDFGVGTFNALDGEMVVLDGQIYQVKSDGKVYEAPDTETTPFAAVTYFDPDLEVIIPAGTDLPGLQTALDSVIPSFNNFYAIRIHGTLKYLKVRSVPGQSKPYPPLTEVTAKQAVFEYNEVKGTVVAFRCPPYVNGVNVAGYHWHFLSDDRRTGGHVLGLQTGDVKTQLDYTPEFLMILPEAGSDFYKIDLSGNQSSNIQKAEK